MLVEIRSTGTQTIIPPSIHPSGERVERSNDGEPAPVDHPAALRRAVMHLACAALLARHWPPKGSRHEAALAAAGLLFRAGLDDVVTVQVVTAAAQLAGEDDHKRDVLDTIAAIRSGEPATGGPRLAELLTGDGEKVVNRLRGWLGVGVADDGGLHATDTGNAERFRLLHGADARYCYSLRAWLWWDGQRFVRDQGDRVMAAAKRIPGAIYAEAARQTDASARTALAAWAKKSEQESRLRALAFLAQSEPGIPISVERLDADGWGLNTPSGMVDLRTGRLEPARREDYCTKVTAAAYDPAADCPRWREFLRQIFAGNVRLVGFVQRAIGYALTGETSEQVFFVFWGAGANGKTTLLRTIFGMLGDYAMSTRPETFMVRGPDSIPNDVARLRGARFVQAVEADQGHRLAEALVKQMTGGDVMTARFMRAEFFDFVPAFKVFLATNYKPVIRGADHAMWRRVRLVPFSVTIPPAEQDHQLEVKLRTEWPGILRWAVEGCLAWQRDGLDVPEEVRVATDAYRADMDVLGQFLAERCIFDQGASVASADIYAAYTAWCEDTKDRPMPKRTFGLRLTERGLVPTRTESTRGWRGARLRTPSDPLTGAVTPDAMGWLTHPDTSSRFAEVRARVAPPTGMLRQEASAGRDASADEVEL